MKGQQTTNTKNCTNLEEELPLQLSPLLLFRRKNKQTWQPPEAKLSKSKRILSSKFLQENYPVNLGAAVHEHALSTF